MAGLKCEKNEKFLRLFVTGKRERQGFSRGHEVGGDSSTIEFRDGMETTSMEPSTFISNVKYVLCV